MVGHRIACLFLMLSAAFCLPSVVARSEDGDPESKKSSKTTRTIEGVISYVGDVPKSKVRDNAGQQRDLIVVDRKSKSLKFVLVYLDVQQAEDRETDEPKGDDKKDDAIVVDQVEHTFVPHLIAIRDGQKVTFKNSDDANHNVRAIAFEEQNQFNVFTGAGGEYRHQFVAEKKLRPIVLSCDIHPWMRAWIYVFHHAYFAVTDERGRFRIEEVPVGEHQLTIIQPDAGYRKTLPLNVKKSEAKPIEVEIKQSDLKIR